MADSADITPDGAMQMGDRRALVYPLAGVPDFGEAMEIAAGVLWMRLPLSPPLAAINVWALADNEGWTLVDTGLHTEETSNLWRRLLAEALEAKPARRVIVTHLHPDHVGMAGWLTRQFDCRLWMTRLEYLQCRMLVDDTSREAPRDALRFYQAAGWSGDDLEGYRARFGSFGRRIHPLPDSYRRLHDGETLTIGGRAWQVVVGAGHSPEHACLYCAELKLLIAGDQVLPRISSNVSVFPTEPDGDPLSEWLTSLARIKVLVPDDVLVLPAHNEPFRGLHARLDHLIRGHERGMERLRRLLAEPRRAADVFGALFARHIGPELIGMATGEALAHLNCLKGRGRAVAEPDKDGVVWWRAA